MLSNLINQIKILLSKFECQTTKIKILDYSIFLNTSSSSPMASDMKSYSICMTNNIHLYPKWNLWHNIRKERKTWEHLTACKKLFTWRRSNWVWELYIIFAGLILLLPKLGLDESQEVLLVHTWRVMDVGINFPHIVEISMGCTFLGQEFTVRIQHQMKTKFLQKILQRNDIDFRVQNPKMVVVLKVHHDDFKPANSLEQWMR